MSSKERSGEMLRTIAGIIFAVIIIPITWLMFVGIAKLIKMLLNIAPNNPLAIFAVVLLFFMLIVITSISKAYVGGNPMQIILKKNKKDVDRQNSETKHVDSSNNPATLILIKSYTLFLIFSFMNFAITIVFISKHILWVALFNALLNTVPIYLIWKYSVRKLNKVKISAIFWISTIMLSVVLVIPYGEFVLDIIIGILKEIFSA